MLLFKKILDFKKSAGGGHSDKRGAKRYPVGAKFAIKAKISLLGRDSEGHLLAAGSNSLTDWGGQLADLSNNGASIRLHPAAVAASGDPCCLKLELDNRIFELDGKVANFRSGAQYVTCGITLVFPDQYTRKAYLQLMEPVLIGATFENSGKAKQDLPGLVKEQYACESDATLSLWRDASGKNPKLFELVVHDYFVRGNTETPGLKIGYRDGAKVGKRVSRPSIPIPMSADHQDEVRRLFQFIVQNLGKGVPAEVRKFLELFAA